MCVKLLEGSWRVVGTQRMLVIILHGKVMLRMGMP